MLTALTPPTLDNIISLADLKAHVRVVDGAEDADLTRMLRQAVDFVERYSGCALDRRQFRWTDKQFCRAMRLPVGPVVSIDVVTYDGSDGAEVELDETAWSLGGDTVHAAAGSTWPYASGNAGSVRVEFTAGFQNVEEAAPMLLAAVEVGCAALFANRERPDWSGAMACADSYRMPGL